MPWFKSINPSTLWFFEITIWHNLASSNPATLKQFVEIIENTLEKKAKINYLPMQKGDVLRTYGDISDSKLDFGYEPKISLEEGIKKFIVWYKNYYGR